MELESTVAHENNSYEQAMTITSLDLYTKYVPKIQKRDGRVVPFQLDKIARVIYLAMQAVNEGSKQEAEIVAHKVASEFVKISRNHRSFIPSVEGCQDEVERQLMLSDYVDSSKHFILYRAERTKIRETQKEIPEHIKALALESSKYFQNNAMGEFVYIRTYSRWIEAENRRETWIETVKRYMDYMKENLGDKLSNDEYLEIHQAILNQEVMPSMRALQFAGEAARRCHTCLYNCAYTAPEELRDFSEVLYLSMQGCGVGFSVESRNIQKLPIVKKQTGEILPMYYIEDTTEGWCDALLYGLETWYSGKDVKFGYDFIREAGARLKVKGGRASGPEPLRQLLNYTRSIILSRQGRRLKNIDAHDVLCMIGACAVAGGVRRTAMISISDLDDEDLRDAKKGYFYNTHGHRSLANNSAVYNEKPSDIELTEEYLALAKSGSGERGIINRGSLGKNLPKRRIELLGDRIYLIGFNPCSEVLMIPKQFCNLSETIARSYDTLETLKKKQRIASILGTYQATLTNFKYISDKWKQNCEEERLLGVSITGQQDCDLLTHAGNDKIFQELKAVAVEINEIYAKRFGIPVSSCVTVTKPSGTASKVLNCSSGIHCRPAPFYIQRIRIAASDPLLKLMRDQGVPCNPESGQSEQSATTFVLEFPIKAPTGSKFSSQLTAIEQLEYWKIVKVNYTEHNPSATIFVGSDEWISTLNWIKSNWDIIAGLSFFPKDDHIYNLAPQEPITEDKYNELIKNFPVIDFSKLILYEKEDTTDPKKELACAGNNCEI